MAITQFEFTTLTVDPYGQSQTQQVQHAPGYVERLGEVTLELMAIPAGAFVMGAPETEAGWHSSQSPQHQVTVARFWIARYPVTQRQWSAVAALPPVKYRLDAKPACFAGADRPVEQVSWHEANEFCQRLSQLTGRSYRLPSEAEWEYACRSGTDTPFHFGVTITTDIANYSGVDWEYQGRICSKGAYGLAPQGLDRRETLDVGSFGVANPFGLYDLHGQVREWCQDCWHSSYEGAPTDGSAWMSNDPNGDCNLRIVRGGSWNSSPRACRSAFRSRLDPESRLYDVGFRVVCTEIP
jgi:formylglycine-generating enzyme required for sulfatase activity